MGKKTSVTEYGTLQRFLWLLVVMLVIDILWISYVMGPLYQYKYASMLEIKLLPAAGFYLVFASGVFYFALANPTTKCQRRKDAFLFGFSVYSGYALTLLAVFSFYESQLAFLEMIWGGLLASISVILVDLITLKNKNTG